MGSPRITRRARVIHGFNAVAELKPPQSFMHAGHPQLIHGFNAVAELKRRAHRHPHQPRRLIHGFNAVAELKLLLCSPPVRRHSVIHGFNAVAELKLTNNYVELLAAIHPRLQRRGRIEAFVRAVLAVSMVTSVIHGINTVAELKPSFRRPSRERGWIGSSTASTPWPN